MKESEKGKRMRERRKDIRARGEVYELWVKIPVKVVSNRLDRETRTAIPKPN